MSNKWYSFDPAKGYRQKRPPEKKLVLVRVKSPLKPPHDCGTYPDPVVVGYRKNGAGCKDSPYFVVPGVGGTVMEWCDCLPDDFKLPIQKDFP